jgi:hypothetical protein
MSRNRYDRAVTRPLLLLVLLLGAFAVDAAPWHQVQFSPARAARAALDMDAQDGELLFTVDASGAVNYWLYTFDANDTAPVLVAADLPGAGFEAADSRVAAGAGLAIIFGGTGAAEIEGVNSYRDLTITSSRWAFVNSSGAVPALLATEVSGALPNVFRRVGQGSWAPTMLDGSGNALVPAGVWLLLAEGEVGVALADGGGVYATTTLSDDNSWSLMASTSYTIGGPQLRGTRDATWVDDGLAVFASLSGLLLIDTANGTADECATPSGETFIRVAGVGGTLYGLHSDVAEDTVFEVPDVAGACADGAISAPEWNPRPTGSTVVAGVGAWLDSSTTPATTMVVSYEDTLLFDGTWTWANRPPLPPGLPTTDAVVGSTTTVTAGAPVDPDPETAALSYDYSCDDVQGQAVVISGNGQTVDITTPTVCPANAGLVFCRVAVVDEANEASSTQGFTVGVVGEDLQAPVLSMQRVEDSSGSPLLQPNPPAWRASPGQPITARVQVTDACATTVTWSSTDGVIATTSGVSEVTFDAPATDGQYTLDVDVTDEGGNTASHTFTIDVFTPSPPVIACAAAQITATDVEQRLALSFDVTPAVDLDFTCSAGEPCVEETAGVPSAIVDACSDDGVVSLTITPVSPTGQFMNLAPVTCEVTIEAPETLPTIARVTPEEVVVRLDQSGASALLAVDGSLHACDAAGALRWDLDEVHAAFRTGCGSACEQPIVDGPEELALKSEPIGFNALVNTTATARAWVVDEDGDESDVVPITLRFVPVQDIGVRAGVRATLLTTDTRTLAAGDLARVTARVETSLGFPLPRLKLEIDDGELAVVPGRVDAAANDCGASAQVQTADSVTVILAEGVTATCPLDVELVARRGLSTDALALARCAWGADEDPIAPCTSLLEVARPRALGCAAAGGNAPALFGLLLLLSALGVSRSLRRS